MFYNLASLSIGFLAWILGTVGIFRSKSKSFCQLSSFICCCTAMLLQFHEIKRLMRIDDWVAVDDTINAICIAAGTLTVITVILNLLAERSKKKGA